MSIKGKLIIAVSLGSILITSSCRKYLDVNKNPNIAQNATVDILLPTGELYIASSMGVDLEVNGSIWAQYWTQNPNSSQYRTLEQYQPQTNDYDYPWQNLYRGAENLYQMYQLAETQSKKQYQAIALLLQAYTFQALTDGWGDVPFTEALKGQPKDGGIVNPHYDAQKIIYNSILSYIDQAIALIDPNDATVPGGDDLIYGGDMNKWLKFANTLKLRVLLRLSEKDPGTAQAGIAALYGAGASFIDSVSDDAQVTFTSTAGNKNPLYAEEVGLQQTQNLVGSKTCIDSMNSNNDPRAFEFYEYTPTTGSIVGVTQGDYSAVIAPGSYSIPSPVVAGDAQDATSATAPVKLLTSYESYFLQAEAAARGWGTGAADVLFYNGILANFRDYGLYMSQILDTDVNALYNMYITGGGYWTQYPTGGTVQQQVRFIITQKWFAMCGNQGFEAWTEWRRTGYPDFFVYSVNSLIGNQFPKRFFYPNDEITRNLNFPGLQPVTSKVWWDIH